MALTGSRSDSTSTPTLYSIISILTAASFISDSFTRSKREATAGLSCDEVGSSLLAGVDEASDQYKPYSTLGSLNDESQSSCPSVRERSTLMLIRVHIIVERAGPRSRGSVGARVRKSVAPRSIFVVFHTIHSIQPTPHQQGTQQQGLQK